MEPQHDSTNSNIIKHFNIEDPSWTEELNASGTVVIKGILSTEEITNARTYFWDWMQSLGSGLFRSDSSTWQNNSWPGLPDLGFFCSYGGCHSKASWYLRTRPLVKKAFAKIYSTEQLITSFDTFIVWRPWWFNSKWKPYVENLHVDQNPSAKRGFHCVQGMIPLYDVVPDVGGLMVVKNSHTEEVQDELTERYPSTTWTSSDWLELKGNDPFIGKGVLVECKAGDLILWDSRTVHGGKICQPSEEYKAKSDPNTLVRLSMTVTMTPRSWASQAILKRRREAFAKKIALTHWPHEYNVSGMGGMAPNIIKQQMRIQELEVTPQIRGLIG